MAGTVSRSSRSLVAASVAIAALLSVPGLGDRSLWQDEGSTWDVTGRSLDRFVDTVRSTETNGSLYNLIVTFWRHLAGDSEVALRVPSVACLLVLVVLVARLAERLVGPQAVGLAAVLTAVHGRFLEHGTEARTYALVLVLVTARSLLFVEEVERPRPLAFAAWVLLGALAVYAHMHASLFVIAEIVAVAALPVDRRHWRRRLAGWAAFGVLCLPLASAVLGRDDLEGLQVLDFGPRILTSVAGALAGGSVVATVVVGSCFAVAVAQLARRRTPGAPDGWRSVYLVAGVLCPTAALSIVSLVQPALLGRYVLYSAVPLLLVVVKLVTSIEAPTVRRALAVVVVAAVATGGLGFRFRGETEDWRAATASVLAGARPGDLMASADDYHLLVVAYYEAHLEREGTGPTPDLVLPTMPIADFHLEDWSYAEITEDGFACAVGGATRLWVFDGAEYFDLERRAQLRTFAAASFGPPSQERRFPGHADIAVRLYEVDDPRPVPPGCGS